MKEFEAHILVVDDDKGIRELVKEYLDQNNFITSTAKDAMDAKEKTKLIKFDLIILDVMMPEKSGLEFLKENKNNLDTPIILLTAKGEASDRIAGLEIGADDYLPKPFEPKELILRIKNILNKTKKRDLKRVIEFENIKIDLNKLIIHKNKEEFKINGIKVSTDSRPYIIAELSANHNGSIDRAKKTILEAKKSNVSAVKIQIYSRP